MVLRYALISDNFKHFNPINKFGLTKNSSNNTNNCLNKNYCQTCNHQIYCQGLITYLAIDEECYDLL